MEIRKRIGYPRSYFHVMNRGARKVSIFADDVDRRIVHRVGDALPHVHLGREMGQHVRLHRREHLGGLRVPDVELVERGVRRNVLSLSGREVVDDVNRPAVLQEALGEVRADEPCSAGDHDRSHQR